MHSTISKLVAQVIDEMGLREKAVCVLPVGCGTLGCHTWNLDMICSAHGRAPAVATGAKRAQPNKIVFTYQGDGDLASIGMAEIVHAATRGEKITVIFINNAIYGMTGGQMAPTSLPGQVTQTTPYGRDTNTAGLPGQGLRDALHPGRRGLCPARYRGLREECEHCPEGH